ncbi:unnamed protein product [Rotaria sp. Silwood1]|nr:unnamed protein product [Rotaria sp. Silwood1]CAF3544788.1 unnamed protein product [Rotaria sp. Silwood1]CAF3549841.1 unnamed protein product [Rotaria sp. Silwood1]CAF4579743.1 unnamed protein product [Rotaria sp. Silwood1]CAF4761612.1 unnamed protein product [Rotaria sp. Silwood1]
MIQIPILFFYFSCFLNNNFVESVQPYFPSQVTFSILNNNGGETIMAIDDVNQKAYQTYTPRGSEQRYNFVMQHFPYTIPNSPESKHYVELTTSNTSNSCYYGTYWKYGVGTYTSFPSHWYYNMTTFKIGNYIKFEYPMIHSSNHTQENEDYWYANEMCDVDPDQQHPCEEIYFIKNTDIPLRTTRVVRRGWVVVQEVTKYRIISTGKPDDRLFDMIPKDWAYNCKDTSLGLLYYPQTSKITLNQSSSVQIWLISPPHRIYGNDTVIVEWQPDGSSECKDCVTWTPERFYFNSVNFETRQELSITRVKNGGKQRLIPVLHGGGYETVFTGVYPIYIE